MDNEFSSITATLHTDVFRTVLNFELKMLYYLRISISHLVSCAYEVTNNI